MYQFGIEIDSPKWKYFLETKELIFTEFISDSKLGQFFTGKKNSIKWFYFHLCECNCESTIWRSLSCESRNKLEFESSDDQYCIIGIVCFSRLLHPCPVGSSPQHSPYSHSAVVLTGSTLCKFPESKVESKVKVPTSNFIAQYKSFDFLWALFSKLHC